MMKKQLTLVFSVIFLVSSAAALSASIDQNPPEDIVLSPENNYEVTVEYSSSSSTGDIKSREWNLLSTAQTDSGVNAEFDFSRTSSTSNIVRLTASDGNTTDVDEVSQAVTDIPNASISAEPQSVNVDENVQFTSNVTNEFGDIESYKWKGDVDASGSSTEQSFSSSGTKSITLQVNDSQGNSFTTDSVTVDVSDPDEEDTDENTDTGGGGGAGGYVPPSKNQSNSSKSNGSTNKQDKVDENTKVIQKTKIVEETKIIEVKPENGFAEINITKGEGVNEISVSVNPSSDRAPVRNVRISSGKSGQVSVSVRDAGRDKPSNVPEPAAKDDRDVYNYQEINTSINDSEIDVAEVDFSVNKSWIEQRNRSKEQVVMKRFNNNNWEPLETRYLNETDEQYNFEASSEGFSYYAVALEDESGSRTDEVNPFGDVPIYVLALIFGFVLVLLVFYLWKFRGSEDQI